MSTFKDLTGQLFGQLTARWPAGITKNDSTKWLCSCTCGTLVVVRASHLRKQRGCGCWKKSASFATTTKNRFETHGMSGTAEYRSYQAARSRCTNPNTKFYRCYGAKGIKFLFNSFEEFFMELGLKPSAKHSVDRIDNLGNYAPGNVRWATADVQANNRIIVRGDVWRRKQSESQTFVVLPLEEIKRLYFEEGLSLYAIGSRYGCSWGTVRKRLIKSGYALRSRGGRRAFKKAA
jgi:hypothetical protein